MPLSNMGRGVGMQLQSFVNSALQRDESSAFHPIHRSTHERPTDIHYTAGCFGPRISLVFEEKHQLPLSESRTTISSPFSQRPYHYAAIQFSFSSLTQSIFYIFCFLILTQPNCYTILVLNLNSF